MHPQVSAVVRLFLALWLAITPTFVWACSMTLCGAGGPAAGGVGPATFTYQDVQGLAGSGSGPYAATGAIGTASANRRVYALLVDTDTSTAISGTPTIGGINCDVVYAAGSGTNNNFFILSAVVPTGTTAAVSVSYTASVGGSHQAYLWTTDKTTLSSPTPYTSSVNNLSGGTSASGSLSSVTSGSAVMMGFEAFGINNGSQNISASTPTMTSAGVAVGASVTGIANNNTAGSQSVTVSWTATATFGSIILAAVK